MDVFALLLLIGQLVIGVLLIALMVVGLSVLLKVNARLKASAQSDKRGSDHPDSASANLTDEQPRNQ